MAGIITAIVLLTAKADQQQAKTVFESLGFKTEAVVGGSLLISGEASLFQKTFAAEILQRENGQFVRAGEVVSRALPREKFPEDVRRIAQAIEFEAPLDFGPSEF